MIRPQYILERWPNGWLLCAAEGQSGVPLDALKECALLFSKDAVMDSGIVHHYNQSAHHVVIVSAIGYPKELGNWRKEIAAELNDLNPQERWWRGTDVGASSAAIFLVCCDSRWREASSVMAGYGPTPRDSNDFGRCQRLLDLFPAWRDRLPEVGHRYPATSWPRIIDRWAEIESSEPRRQTEILSEIAKNER